MSFSIDSKSTDVYPHEQNHNNADAENEISTAINNDRVPLETSSVNILKRITENNQGLITSLILFLLQLVNMTDRYIVSSVLLEVEAFFQVSKSTAGLLQTVFLLSYMAFSPLNGYLGDRINRKYLLIASILLWMISTIGGSLVGSKFFYLFVLSRCLFGIATASFETIAVPIIGDRHLLNIFIYYLNWIIYFNI